MVKTKWQLLSTPRVSPSSEHKSTLFSIKMDSFLKISAYKIFLVFHSTFCTWHFFHLTFYLNTRSLQRHQLLIFLGHFPPCGQGKESNEKSATYRLQRIVDDFFKSTHFECTIPFFLSLLDPRVVASSLDSEFKGRVTRGKMEQCTQNESI